MKKEKTINTTSLNDLLPEPAPAIVNEDQLENIIDAIDTKKINKNPENFSISTPNATLHYFLTALNLLPHNERNAVVKQIVVWDIAGDDVLYEYKTNKFIIKKGYKGIGYPATQIYKKLCNYGYKQDVDKFIGLTKDLTDEQKGEVLVAFAHAIVMENIDNLKLDIVPVPDIKA